MSTMPDLVGFSLDYANIQLSALNVTPTITYQVLTAPFRTPDIILSQSPSAGQTISGTVSLVLSGIFTHRGIGPTIFNQPANYVQPITSPG